MHDTMTIVTAFYDIKREHLDNFKRDYTKYYQYFAFWAGVKNPLVVYTTQEHKEAILQIRRDKGLEHLTRVITKTLWEFDIDALEAIQKVFRNFNLAKGRKNPQNIECLSAEYCYLTYCKPIFVCDAIKRGIVGNEVLWLDFGFNHGGKFYKKPFADFTLSPQSSINRDKFNVFCVKDDENARIVDIFYSMETILMGGALFGNNRQWDMLLKHFSKALETLVSMNIFDDDQFVLLWCYRNFSQEFHILRAYEWFDALEYFIPKEISQTLEKNPKESLPYRQAKRKCKNAYQERNIKQFFYYGLLYIWYKILTPFFTF